MTPAERAVEALVSGRRMRRADAVSLLCTVEADALREEADRIDGLHVGLIVTWNITTLMRQRAADIAPTAIGGAA